MSHPVYLNADRPRSKLVEDELGYRGFAEAIAASIAGRADNEGFVMAIHGKWGSGKTSAVNMVVDALDHYEANLDERNCTIVVRFNPWWFSEQKDLTRAFFDEVIAAIGKRASNAVRDGLRVMAKKVSGASELISSALSWTPAAPFAKVATEIIKAAGEGIEDERSLGEVRETLAKALRDEARRIVVIIDDVDRLPADEARQIFRLVKSVADLPCVTYLLVFDREIAARALERPSEPAGPEWLEKIVQASFDLPIASQTDLNRLFLARLGIVLGDTRVSDMVRWGNVFHGSVAPWLRTARDVGRLANAVAVAWPAVRGEVDVADFVALETIRLFEPLLYTFVRSHPNDLTGDERRDTGTPREAFGEELLSKVDNSKRSHTERALKIMFPRLGAVFGNTWSTGEDLRAERALRISSRRRFPVYFNLSLGDRIISIVEMEALRATFQNPDKTRSMIQNYAAIHIRTGGTRAAVLLSNLAVFVDTIPDAEAEQAALALLYSGDLFLNRIDGDQTPEGFPTIWTIWFAVNPLLSKLERDRLISVLTKAIDGPSLKSANFMVNLMGAEHGRWDAKEAKPENERRLPLEAVIELEHRMAERIKTEAISGELLNQLDAGALIFAWARFSGNEAVRSWTDNNLNDIGFSLWIMETFTSQGTVHSVEDLVSSRFQSVSREAIAPLVDTDRLKEIAETILATEQDRDNIASNFLSGLRHRL